MLTLPGNGTRRTSLLEDEELAILEKKWNEFQMNPQSFDMHDPSLRICSEEPPEVVHKVAKNPSKPICTRCSYKDGEVSFDGQTHKGHSSVCSELCRMIDKFTSTCGIQVKFNITSWHESARDRKVKKFNIELLPQYLPTIGSVVKPYQTPSIVMEISHSSQLQISDYFSCKAPFMYILLNFVPTSIQNSGFEAVAITCKVYSDRQFEMSALSFGTHPYRSKQLEICNHTLPVYHIQLNPDNVYYIDIPTHMLCGQKGDAILGNMPANVRIDLHQLFKSFKR